MFEHTAEMIRKRILALDVFQAHLTLRSILNMNKIKFNEWHEILKEAENTPAIYQTLPKAKRRKHED